MKKVLALGADVPTHAELLLMIKRWLLIGKRISNGGADSRTKHVKKITRAQLRKGVSADQIDLELARAFS